MVGIGIERVFRTRGQIAVLRALWKAPTSLTGRQVQHLAGVHNRTAMQSLEDLAQLGVVQCRSAGRANLYALKRSHWIVRDLIEPAFKAEQLAPDRLKRELADAVESHCISAILYGSVARGQAGPSSDIDLLVVVRNKRAAESFAEKAQSEAEHAVRDGWGAMLEVNVKTIADLRRQWDTRLMKRIRREGLLVAGRPLAEVRRGRSS